jgi:nitroreductase
MAQTIMLVATSLELHTAFINPQVRERDRDYFYERFGAESLMFCGAVAIGYPHHEPIEKTRRLIDSVVL